jgi:hypothetical protein
MKFKYYMHDSKEDAVYATYKLLEKMGENVTEETVYNHPLYEKIFCQLYQNELTLHFDADKQGNLTFEKVSLQNGG